MRNPLFNATKATPLLTLLLLSGCFLNPALYKKGAFAVDDWATWTSWNDAYGAHDVSSSGLAYSLSANQDDAQDMPFDGRYPGLILSRTFTGLNWRLEVSGKFKVPADGGLKRFSFGVWLGTEYARPSIGSASSALKLLAQRQNGPGPDDDIFIVSASPADDTPVKIPNAAKTLRFEKSGRSFSVSYSLDGKNFVRALSVESEEAAEAESRKFIVCGRSNGKPHGASAKFTSLKINGNETLR